MVSDRLIVTLLIVAILLSVFSIVMTLSINASANLYNNPPTSSGGNTQANIQLTVAPNPNAGPNGSGA